MEELAAPTRKRKSRFDVPPEGVLNQVNQVNPSASFDADSFLSSILPATVPSTASFSPYQPFVTFTEPFFTERLHKAMEKNLAYIERKDSLAAAGMVLSAPKIIVNPTANIPKKNANEVKPGLGAAVTSAPKHGPPAGYQESTSIYVSGLPLDITKEELEILFGSVGKLRKVKIYVDEAGVAKGDALISYIKQDSIYFAIQKYDGCDIGDGFVLHVSKAKFTPKNQEQDVAHLRSLLPERSNNALYPVVLVKNIYDGASDVEDDFVDDLRNEIYSECAKFGSVNAVLAPTAPSLLGSLAITFTTEEAAISCRSALDQRKFDGRVLTVVIIPSLPPAELTPAISNIETQIESNPEEMIDDAVIEQVEQNVEDFLNSLL